MYATRFPECLKPGAFDVAFHSHQARHGRAGAWAATTAGTWRHAALTGSENGFPSTNPPLEQLPVSWLALRYTIYCILTARLPPPPPLSCLPQLFHVAVVVAACIHYKAVRILLAWRDASGGCLPPMPAAPPLA